MTSDDNSTEFSSSNDNEDHFFDACDENRDDETNTSSEEQLFTSNENKFYTDEVYALVARGELLSNELQCIEKKSSKIRVLLDRDDQDCGLHPCPFVRFCSEHGFSQSSSKPFFLQDLVKSEEGSEAAESEELTATGSSFVSRTESETEVNGASNVRDQATKQNVNLAYKDSYGSLKTLTGVDSFGFLIGNNNYKEAVTNEAPWLTNEDSQGFVTVKSESVSLASISSSDLLRLQPLGQVKPVNGQISIVAHSSSLPALKKNFSTPLRSCTSFSSSGYSSLSLNRSVLLEKIDIAPSKELETSPSDPLVTPAISLTEIHKKLDVACSTSLNELETSSLSPSDPLMTPAISPSEINKRFDVLCSTSNKLETSSHPFKSPDNSPAEINENFNVVSSNFLELDTSPSTPINLQTEFGMESSTKESFETAASSVLVNVDTFTPANTSTQMPSASEVIKFTPMAPYDNLSTLSHNVNKTSTVLWKVSKYLFPTASYPLHDHISISLSPGV